PHPQRVVRAAHLRATSRGGRVAPLDRYGPRATRRHLRVGCGTVAPDRELRCLSAITRRARRDHERRSGQRSLRARGQRPAVRVVWMSFARSASTFVLSTVPPSPRISWRITSMSPTLSNTNKAEVPGFIIPSTSRTKSPPIPTDAAATPLPAAPSIAPTAAPASEAASTSPARKPTGVEPRRLVAAGNGSGSRVKDPSRCRTTTATSARSRYDSFHPSLVITLLT